MQMHHGLKYWTVDEVAECLGVSSLLQAKLWGFLSKSTNRTPLGDDIHETPDVRLDKNNGDKLIHWWRHLSDSEKLEINSAYKREYE